jgi:carboxypeptidase Q
MKRSFSLASALVAAFLLGSCLTPGSLWAQSSNAAPSSRRGTNDPIARIRDEGMNRSQVMKTLLHLTDVIGPRLTGSPNLARANAWTRDTLTEWGLENAQLEAWGPFGRGWSLQRFSAQIIEPQSIPLIATPKAWTPGFSEPITAEVVLIEAKNEADLEKYQGKLKGKILLASPLREVRARFEPLATRVAESNLLRLANAGPGDTRPIFAGRPAGTNAAASTNAARSVAAGPRGSNTPPFSLSTRVLSLAVKEGAALVVTSSREGDGGSIFVEQASVPTPSARGTNAPAASGRLSPWATNAPPMPAQIALGVEDYNRLVRMIQHGEKLKMNVDLQVKFHDEDLMGYNTIAEIPGSDLKEEVVMIGAHLDSWHVGTGATDNGAGVAATMEAMRILKTLGLQPRRTIRIALWTGEEQGLFGSTAYVTKHFGYMTNITNAASSATRSPRDESNQPRRSRSGSTNSVTRKLVKHDEYENFSAYFNLDNGAGKIRGVYLQNNESARPVFRRWLQPFSDLGAETLTYSNTGATDHVPFDRIGLPGFQFIQDPIEYWTRTHHSTADVYDRIQADDLKQASTIMAAFLWNAATMNEKVPRKALP